MDRVLGRLLVMVVALAVRPPPACAQGCDAPGICAKGKVCGTNKTMKSGHTVCFNNCCYDPDNDKPGGSAICCNIGLSEDGEAGIGWCCPKYHTCGQADRSGKAKGPLCICEGGMDKGVCQCADSQKCGAFCC